MVSSLLYPSLFFLYIESVSSVGKMMRDLIKKYKLNAHKKLTMSDDVLLAHAEMHCEIYEAQMDWFVVNKYVSVIFLKHFKF